MQRYEIKLTGKGDPAYLCPMKILVAAATEGELGPLQKLRFPGHDIHFLVTGVGMTATTHSLTRELLTNAYDLVLNIGLAGSFVQELPLGTVVCIEEDILAELGAENGDGFLTLSDMKLEGKVGFVNKDHEGFAGLRTYRKARAITVNTVHGSPSSIDNILRRLHPQVESMEGAAIFYVCEQEHVKALQIRSISNRVEARNRDAWNIPLALENLHASVRTFLETLQ